MKDGFRHLLGCHSGRPSGARGRIENGSQPLGNSVNLLGQPLPRGAAEVLAGDADDPAAIDHVVGGEKYAALVETHRVCDGFQLIVGGAGNDAAPQPGDGLCVQHRAEGAGREYVDILKQDFVR